MKELNSINQSIKQSNKPSIVEGVDFVSVWLYQTKKKVEYNEGYKVANAPAKGSFAKQLFNSDLRAFHMTKLTRQTN
jgi:hypothetical protein